MYHILVYDTTIMTHISYRKLPEKTEEELINNLKIVFKKINKDEEISSFFLSLLSSTEQLMLSKRLAIIVLLQEGIPEYKISDMLNVTRITVERMRLFWETKGEGFKIALSKLEEEKRLKDFKNMLFELTDYALNPRKKVWEAFNKRKI